MKRALRSAVVWAIGAASLAACDAERPTAAPRPQAPAAPPAAASTPDLPAAPVPSPPLPSISIRPGGAVLLEARAVALRSETLPAPFDGLRALATPKRAPGPADWLAQHEERGQSFAAFRTSHPALPGRVLYLTTAEALDEPHAAIVRELEPLLRAFFQLDVRWLPPLPSAEVRDRQRAGLEGRQLFTHTVMGALVARRPADAVAFLALTQTDLYPDPTWNFVYGQADYAARVGVMSLARDGDPAVERELLLRRAFGTSAHEIGHMFGLRHCIAWECAMNGHNHRAEADAMPLELCPACLAKLRLAIGFDPDRRWRALVRAYVHAGLGADALAATKLQRAAASR